MRLTCPMSPVFPNSRRTSVAFLAVLLLACLVGCGEKDKTKIKVAEVEDRVITLEYFERKMNTVDPSNLPPDVNSPEGRRAFLDVIINKEVMALKAEELGFAQDGEPDNQAKVVSDFKATDLMRAEIVKDSENVSEAEILAYYENLARALRLSYMLFDFVDQAVEAKRLVEGGEQWLRIAERFDAGDPGPQADWTMTLKYGTVADDLERAVFALPIGAISDPIDSVYGYFLVRVEEQVMERVGTLEELRPRIIASIQKQKSQLLINDFLYEVFETYHFQLFDEPLKLVWEALPPDASLSPPTPTEELEPLRLSPEHFDQILMSWDGEQWSLKRYFDFYNESGVFGRPRQEQRVGTLRRRLKEIAVRDLMSRAARDRGYTELPEVRDEYKLRREQMMVTRLHDELVKGQIIVTPEETQVRWDENPRAYDRKAQRHVYALSAATEQDALKAMAEAKAPRVNWAALVGQYCADTDLRQRGGDLGFLMADDPSEIARIAFELNSTEEVSYPRQLADGNWAIVRLAEIKLEFIATFADVKLQIGEQLKREKEEALFQQRVAEWKAGFAITVYEKNLDKAVYAPVTPKGTTIDVSTGMPVGS